MIFANVKALSIPEGVVTKIESAGKTLWAKKSSYKNWLPFATNADRTTIMDGVGYKKGYRLSSSGSESVKSDMCASGFIFPCKVGDVVRIKGTKPQKGVGSYLITYNSSNAKTGYQSFSQKSDGSDWYTAGGHYQNGVLTYTLDESSFGTGFDAFRFSAGVIDENTIVTINEEITE